jgi:type II secretory pathway pseudopilin PulG
MMSICRDQRGFTLAEAIVAMALTLIVSLTAFALVTPASFAAVVQPEMTDVEQRARVAAETLARELGRAGAGIDAGPRRGALNQFLPAVLPRRFGLTSGDAPGTARPDAITIITVPATASQTTTAAAVSASSLVLSVNAAPNCPPASALCGLTAGQDVLIADDAGHFDLFRILTVSGATATLKHHGQQLAWVYPAGSVVTVAESRTFYLDAPTAILRLYDGGQSDQPLVDQIAALSFSYLGDAPGGGLDVMPLASFSDGPWRGAGSSAFDEDLLKVRAIRVSVTARAADPSLRTRVVPFGVTLDVAPRNLSVGR